MSELLSYMKELYLTALENRIVWKPVYPNNMPCNGKEGWYTIFWFKREDGWELMKYTIQFGYRVTADGLSHPEEGICWYILHEYHEEEHLPERLEMPEPSDDEGWLFDEPEPGMFPSNFVNSYGRFCSVFDDEDTPRQVVRHRLLHRIYPYTYILSEEDGAEWNRFIDEHPWEEE